MIEIKIENKEVNITLNYQKKVGGKYSVEIFGTGDLSHHLVEGLFEIVDKLASTESIGHQSDEWIKKR